MGIWGWGSSNDGTAGGESANVAWKWVTAARQGKRVGGETETRVWTSDKHERAESSFPWSGTAMFRHPTQYNSGNDLSAVSNR